MKRKSKNIEKVFLNILNNKISLYLVSLIAILVIINNLMNNNYVEVFIFYVIAGLVFLYTKNMTLILLVSLIGSCIFSNYKKVIFKEMALLKVVGQKKKIEKCIKACKSFNPVVLDKTKKSVVIQITALRREIDKMSKKLKSLGLISTSRTGAIAMTRGADVFK